MLQRRPEGRQIVATGILNPENAMRIANIHHARALQHAAIGQGVGKIDGACILESARKRNLVPLEAGRTHVDGDKPARPGLRIEHAGAGFDGEPVPAKAGAQQCRHAPARIAASAHLGAVGVQNTHEHVRGPRRLQHDDLIAAHSPGAACNRAGRDCGQP